MEGKTGEFTRDLIDVSREEKAIVEAAWDFVVAAEAQMHVPAIDSAEFRRLHQAVADLRWLGRAKPD